MHNLVSVLAGILLSGLVVMPSAAEAESQPQTRHKVRLNAPADSKVPQAQKATVQKRELAKQQRDRKLKQRATNAQAKGGPTSLPKPVHR